MHFVAIKMGRRQGGPSRTGGGSGAYLNRYVTDEQRGRRPIFIATLWAGAGWLFLCVALSARMVQIGALRSRLEKQPTDLRQNTCYFEDRTLVTQLRNRCNSLPALVDTSPNRRNKRRSSRLAWGAAASCS
jgi:hypothetical protein